MSTPMTIAYGRTLSRELGEQAHRHPDRIWMTFQPLAAPAISVTYGEFAHQVDRCANALAGLGIQPGDKILIVLTNCPDFLLLWFGAARIGAVIVPANIQSSDPELEYLAGHSESVIVAIGATDVERGRRLRRACPRLRHVLVCGAPAGADDAFATLLAQSAAAPPEHEPRSEDEVAIMYTSGTTSRPKGCLITNANYIHVGEAVAQHVAVNESDKQLVVMPYFHGNAQYYSTMSALVAGASIVVAERFSASRFWDTAAEHQTTIVSLFAAPMRMLLAQPDTPIPEHRMRLALFAQNLTPTQLLEWDRRFHVPALQIYGMTEQLGWPLANPLNGRRDNLTVGRPTLPFRCRIVDDHDREVPDGVAGSLLVQGIPGVSLMKAYFKDPDATAGALRQFDGMTTSAPERWLVTGDNVRRRHDGLIEFVDRSKDMIKRSGENVAASEVEEVLRYHPAVFDVAVIGVPDATRDEAIKAFVVLRQGQSVAAEELISWCASRLAKFRVPTLVEFRTELPRTSVGKIQKHLLRIGS